LLTTESGLSLLLEASLLLEPRKTVETCRGLGLSQLAEALEPKTQA